MSQEFFRARHSDGGGGISEVPSQPVAGHGAPDIPVTQEA
jgi:hypothetical protein